MNPEEPRRPRTRGECIGGPRPCPHVRCKWHLLREVEAKLGRSRRVHLADLAESCALDVADRGGVTLEEVAAVLDITRERVRQIEAGAVTKLRRGLAEVPQPPR